ncbi:MAG: alpha/beta fold hydrolase [Nitrososphaera sp.]
MSPGSNFQSYIIPLTDLGIMKNTTIKLSVWRNKGFSPLGNGNAKNMFVKADKRKIEYSSSLGKVMPILKKDRFLVLMGLGIMLAASSGLPPSPSAFATTQNNITEPPQTQSMSTTSTTNSTTTPNIVLVHGLWADGSSWSKVIPILQNAGYRVTAVQLAEHSLAEDVDTVKRAIDLVGGPTILVAHSFGGFVITQAAYNNSNVTGLVYVSAFAPDEGESAVNFVPVESLPPGLLVFDSGGFAYLNPEMFPQAFAQDVNATEAKTMAAVQKPAHQSLFTEKSGPPAWKQHPTWFEVSEGDHIIPPDAQRMFAQRMNATTISLNSSHASLVSHPDEIAQLILDAARGSTG